MARITTGLSLGMFCAIMLFLACIACAGLVAFIWILLWGVG